MNDKNLLSLLTLCPFVPAQKPHSAVGRHKDRKTEETEGFFNFELDKNLLSLLFLVSFCANTETTICGRKTEGQKDRRNRRFFAFVNDKNLLSLLTLCPFVPAQKPHSVLLYLFFMRRGRDEKAERQSLASPLHVSTIYL